MTDTFDFMTHSSAAHLEWDLQNPVMKLQRTADDSVIISSGTFCSRSIMRTSLQLLVQPFRSVVIVIRLLGSLGLVAISISPCLRPCGQGWYYQEFRTPYGVALRIIGSRKPFTTIRIDNQRYAHRNIIT